MSKRTKNKSKKKSKNVDLVIFSSLLLFFFILTNTLPAFSLNRELTVKAVFIERFVQFINWPNPNETLKKNEPFVFALIGYNPFGTSLQKMYENRKFKGKEVKIVHLANINEINKIKNVHLIFIGKVGVDRLQKILSVLKNRPILSISDSNGFAQAGVIINFYLENNFVRFEVNKKALEDSKLSMSYHLFMKAKIINASKGKR